MLNKEQALEIEITITFHKISNLFIGYLLDLNIVMVFNFINKLVHSNLVHLLNCNQKYGCIIKQ